MHLKVLISEELEELSDVSELALFSVPLEALDRFDIVFLVFE